MADDLYRATLARIATDPTFFYVVPKDALPDKVRRRVADWRADAPRPKRGEVREPLFDGRSLPRFEDDTLDAMTYTLTGAFTTNAEPPEITHYAISMPRQHGRGALGRRMADTARRLGQRVREVS